MRNMGNGGKIYMKTIDHWFILMAIIYAILGMVLGLWMGINKDFSHTQLHAHFNLVGWASMALFGLIYRAYPDLASSRLSRLHFMLMAIGTPVMGRNSGCPFRRDRVAGSRRFTDCLRGNDCLSGEFCQ